MYIYIYIYGKIGFFRVGRDVFSVYLSYTFSVEVYSILAAASIFILLNFECSVDCALRHCPMEWFHLLFGGLINFLQQAR